MPEDYTDEEKSAAQDKLKSIDELNKLMDTDIDSLTENDPEEEHESEHEG